MSIFRSPARRRLVRRILAGTLAVALGLVNSPVLAREWAERIDEPNVFAFTGRITDNSLQQSLYPLGVGYEDNYVTGFGAQRLIYQAGPVSLGYEAGIAMRYGMKTTGEIWGGAVGRWREFNIFGSVLMAPSLVVGLSYVNAAQPGRETNLENRREDGDAHLLFYLGPELDFRASPDSRYSAFWRLQHRSGANGTLGNMRGATNANVFGLRIRF